MAIPRVWIVCPGVGHVWRGFETFSHECFQALRGETSLELSLIGGANPAAAGERAVPTLRRDRAAARRLGRLTGRDPYVVEQLSFTLALVPRLARARPDLILFSDWVVGRALARWRAASRQRFRLLVSNGGLYPPGTLRHVDHVQQLTPHERERALAAGEPESRHTLLPLGVAMDPVLRLPSDDERRGLRERLRLPIERKLVLSVGALTLQKRPDYLFEEIASLPSPRPYLVLLGQPEPDADRVRALALSRLGPDGVELRTVPRREVQDYYRAADAFVLASLWEAFGRVMIEAMSHGLPCVAHDAPTPRYVLGEHGFLSDLTLPGNLAGVLHRLLGTPLDAGEAERRHRFVHERFSWERLAPRYVELLRRQAAGPPAAP